MDSDGFLKLSRVPKLATARGVSAYGHFDGKPGVSDALMHRKILLLFTQGDPPDMVLIARDTDKDSNRAIGFEQACKDRRWPFKVILALSEPEVEAWIISALDPRDESETKKLEGLRKELGFDPTAQSEKLTSTARSSKKDTKEILSRMGGEEEGLRRFLEVDPDELAKNGKRNGLMPFLKELTEHVPPLFGAHTRG